MKIVLIVDNPYRDLPGLVLLAATLCRQGATCFLVPMYGTGELIMLAPDVVLFNYLRVNNQESAQQMQRAGVKVCVLDTEGGVLPDLERYTQTAARDRELFRYVSRYFSWGPRLAEYLESEGLYVPEQIAVTGSPRLDFYVPPLRFAALGASTYVEAYRQPLVLFNGNFPFSNPRFQTPEEEVGLMVNHFGFDRSLMLEWQDKSRRGMQELTALCNSLARRFPHVTFVYRPHPFENAEAYGPLLEKRENLHLAKVGTVDGWILRSSAVIQRGCSTAIEAAIAGIPAISPAWIPTVVPMPTAEAVSVCYETEEALVRALDSILAGTFESPPETRRALENVISEWFYKVDGRAHERIAAHLIELAGKGNGSVLENCRDLVYATSAGENSLRRKARTSALKTLNLPPDWSFRRSLNPFGRASENGSDPSWTRASEKYFDAEDVRKLVGAIEPYMEGGPQAGTGKIKVQSSQERGDYHFGYRHGRAVTVFSE